MSFLRSSKFSNVQKWLKYAKAVEKDQTFDRIIEWSRLPVLIKHNGKTYHLAYGSIDERVYLSYVDESVHYGDPNRVLMHYEETMLRDCISKAWRNLAENNIKIRRAK